MSKVILNYLAWIANLGVVPLFLLAAFLLAPALFFFACLLFVVTFVLDTIKPLLLRIYKGMSFKYKKEFLPIIGQSVKEILIVLCAFLSTNSPANELLPEYVIGRGEAIKIEAPSYKNVIISNKEVVKLRHMGKNIIYIKGSAIGETDLIFNNSINHIEKKIKIYVINKNLDLKFGQMTSFLQSMGIKTRIFGKKITLEGELKNASDYFRLKEIINGEDNLFVDQTILNNEVKKEILGQIYFYLLKKNILNIECSFTNNFLSCGTENFNKLSKSSINEIQQLFSIKIVETNAPNLTNYQLEIRFIQLEDLSGRELRFGLESIEANLSDFFNMPIRNIVEKNAVSLKDANLHLSSLAEPKLVSRLNIDNEFKIGAEIPIEFQEENGKKKHMFKFYGLKFNYNIVKEGEHFILKYNNLLTRPNEDNESSGSETKSEIVLKENQVAKLFEVQVKTIQNLTEAMPFLSQIPIIGEIFKSKNNSDNYKSIHAIVVLRKLKDDSSNQ